MTAEALCRGLSAPGGGGARAGAGEQEGTWPKWEHRWVTGAPQKAQPGATACSIMLPSGMWPAWHERGSCMLTQGRPKKWVPTPRRGGMPDLGVWEKGKVELSEQSRAPTATQTARRGCDLPWPPPRSSQKLFPSPETRMSTVSAGQRLELPSQTRALNVLAGDRTEHRQSPSAQPSPQSLLLCFKSCIYPCDQI